MAIFNRESRVRLSDGRNQLLIALSGGSIVFLSSGLEVLLNFQVNQGLLVLALIGLAFTLFAATGLQIVAAAADRWTTETVAPALLIWEWRIQAAAYLSFMLSGILLVSYLVENLRAMG